MRETTLSELQRLSGQAGITECALQMDEEAFGAFYDRTARGLWSYLSRITGDRQLADDLMQEAYYRFLRASRTYENETHRRNSLYYIATNLVRDVRRRPVTLPMPDSPDHAALRGEGDPAARMDRRQDLHRAMAQLNPRERQMLWLAYAQGESHKDIANALGLKSGSIRLLLFRARRKLAALLRGCR